MDSDGPYLEHLLAADPLRAAEKMTGGSYGDDRTFPLALVAMEDHRDAKVAALSGAGDTWFSCPLGRHLNVAARLGFRVVWERPILRGDGTDRHLAAWADDGLLLILSSYQGRTNNAMLGCNLRSDDLEDLPSMSGHWHCAEQWACMAATDTLDRADSLALPTEVRSRLRELTKAVVRDEASEGDLTTALAALAEGGGVQRAFLDRLDTTALDEAVQRSRTIRRAGHQHVWVGTVDVREGLAVRVHQLRRTAALCTPWEQRPERIGLLAHDDRHGTDLQLEAFRPDGFFTQREADRFAQWPDWLRTAVGGRTRW